MHSGEATFTAWLAGILTGAAAVGMFAYVHWQRRKPSARYSIALVAASTVRSSSVVTREDGQYIAIHIDLLRLEKLLPHAEQSVRDGLMTIEQAAALLADECSHVRDKDA